MNPVVSTLFDQNVCTEAPTVRTLLSLGVLHNKPDISARLSMTLAVATFVRRACIINETIFSGGSPVGEAMNDDLS